jgi:hypothetical protein
MTPPAPAALAALCSTGNERLSRHAGRGQPQIHRKEGSHRFLASHLGNPDNCQDIVPLYPPPRAIKRQGKPRRGWNQVSQAKAITV